MRIVVWNWSSRQVAGAEAYLHELLPALSRAGHEIAFACEQDGPADRRPIALPAGSPFWTLDDSLAAKCADWRPDCIFVHGRIEEDAESQLLKIAPGAYFLHNYYGTCISGIRAHGWPRPEPCTKQFGPACLVHYLPRRCGGLSPVTMIRLYSSEQHRLAAFGNYSALLTHSEHMRQEYIRHGIPPERIFAFPFLAGSPPREQAAPSPPWGDAWRLLFLGRMEPLKGGHMLLESLPVVAARLGSRVELTLGGDGPAKAEWERLARQVEARTPNVIVRLPGWIHENDRDQLLSSSHLLVVPSLWPEPFGKVGPEAGFHGVPAAAFRAGGIPDWLTEGVNGALAPGDPPSAEGLADAILRCIGDPQRYQVLRDGAFRSALRFTPDNHVAHLVRILGSLPRSGWK